MGGLLSGVGHVLRLLRRLHRLALGNAAAATAVALHAGSLIRHRVSGGEESFIVAINLVGRVNGLFAAASFMGLTIDGEGGQDATGENERKSDFHGNAILPRPPQTEKPSKWMAFS